MFVHVPCMCIYGYVCERRAMFVPQHRHQRTTSGASLCLPLGETGSILLLTIAHTGISSLWAPVDSLLCLLTTLSEVILETHATTPNFACFGGIPTQVLITLYQLNHLPAPQFSNSKSYFIVSECSFLIVSCSCFIDIIFKVFLSQLFPSQFLCLIMVSQSSKVLFLLFSFVFPVTGFPQVYSNFLVFK